MSANLIISYDGTANDDDALALGKMLAPAGFALALAYVRHAREFDPSREALAQHDAEQRLERGASLLGDPDITRYVVIGASTGARLEQLAERRRSLSDRIRVRLPDPAGSHRARHLRPALARRGLGRDRHRGRRVAHTVRRRHQLDRGAGGRPTNEVARETANVLAQAASAPRSCVRRASRWI